MGIFQKFKNWVNKAYQDIKDVVGKVVNFLKGAKKVYTAAVPILKVLFPDIDWDSFSGAADIANTVIEAYPDAPPEKQTAEIVKQISYEQGLTPVQTQEAIRNTLPALMNEYKDENNIEKELLPIIENIEIDPSKFSPMIGSNDPFIPGLREGYVIGDLPGTSNPSISELVRKSLVSKKPIITPVLDEIPIPQVSMKTKNKTGSSLFKSLN